MLTRRSGTTLSCFSPPVMIATFIIEVGMLAYVLWRYKLNLLAKLVCATLASLALFQLAEYFVCTESAAVWSRIGFAAISMLPPLGLHLLYVLADRKQQWLIRFAYASAAVCVTYFLMYSQAFQGHDCEGNYVIFQLGRDPTLAYALYYYGWLIIAIALGIYFWQRAAGAARRRSIAGLLAGYLVFLAPTAVVTTVFPDSVQGIPSIMCGFAVLLAFILTLYILPLMGRLKE